jgi:hypothetical protein
MWSDQYALALKLLEALRKTGGLEPRIQAPVLPPAFAPALARFLAVYNTWSEAGYKVMLADPRLPTPMEAERGELATLKSLHGACTGYKPLAVLAPRVARVALQCERGTLELFMTLVDDRILGFHGTSRDVPAPPPLPAPPSGSAGSSASGTTNCTRSSSARARRITAPARQRTSPTSVPPTGRARSRRTTATSRGGTSRCAASTAATSASRSSSTPATRTGARCARSTRAARRPAR